METYQKEDNIGGIPVTRTYTKTSNLHNWEDNPREIRTEMFDYLIKSLFEEGQLMPMLVDVRPGKMGTILGGNMTFRAWTQNLNKEEVWIEPRLPRDDNHAIEIALKHNANYGQYIELKLQEMAQKLKDAGIDIASIPIPAAPEINLAQLLQQVSPDVTEDEAPLVNENEPAVSQLGEVYQLGRHRLMCGDATKIEDVEKLMNGQKADMIFTDPPYGVDYTSRVDEERLKGWGDIQNDNLKGPELQTFLRDSLAYFNGLPCYICCNWQSVVDFWQAYGKPNAFIIWDKGSIGLGAGYRNQHEIILFYGTLDHNSETNVWSIHRDNTNDYDHPTQKPIAIPARGIKNSSHEGQIIVDLFGGSGSTLIACEQTNRTCYMAELDPKYCDVIRKRYAKFIGREEEWQTITAPVQ